MRTLDIVLRGTPLLALIVAGGLVVVGGEERAVASQAPPALRTTDSPEKILTKAQEAYGGQKTVDRWAVGKVRYRVNVGSFPGLPPGSAAVVEDTFQYPKFSKRVATTQVDGKPYSMVFVINGDKFWMKKADGTVKELPLKPQKTYRHMFGGYYDLAPLMDKGVKVAVVGEERVAGRPAILLKVSSESIGQRDLYFDKESALLVKVRASVTQPRTGKKVTQESFFEDPKEVEGGKVPTRIRAYHDGELILDVTLLEIQFFKRIDEKEFAKP